MSIKRYIVKMKVLKSLKIKKLNYCFELLAKTLKDIRDIIQRKNIYELYFKS